MRRPQNLKKPPECFDKTVAFTQYCQNKWEIFSNFCGLLRKVELYLGHALQNSKFFELCSTFKQNR